MTATTIARKFEWDMGHRVPDHESLCFNPHGHRYVAEVVFSGLVNQNPGSPERGMVIDFAEVKTRSISLFDSMDHAFMVYHEDPFAAHLAHFARHIGRAVKILEVPFIPTAEEIAAYVFDKLTNRNLPVVEVTVWETPNCKATVRRN